MGKAACIALCLVTACGDDGPGATASPSSRDSGAQSAGDGGSASARDAGSPSSPDSGPPPGARDAGGPSTNYGSVYTGGEFHLGPVDWDETAYHNACASENKYPASVRSAEGELLGAVWNGVGKPEDMCDQCIAVTTALGKSATLRVVSYGDTTRNSIDVSPAAYSLLNSGEYPRNVSWQLTKCPESGALMYEFKSGSNQWWTAFWVRNPRVPIARVEVQAADGAFVSVSRESDGSFVDASGVGAGAFAIRVTAADGQVLTDSFTWSESQLVGQVKSGQANFR